MKARVLLASHHPAVLEGLASQLGEGHELLVARTSEEARALLATRHPDALVASPVLEDGDALTLLTRAQRHYPDLRCLLVAASPDEAAQLRRFHGLIIADCLEWPCSAGNARRTLSRALGPREELASQAAELARSRAGRALVGESASWMRCIEQLGAVGPGSRLLLLTGRPGTGKSSLALAAHGLGELSSGPFVSLPCLALAEGEAGPMLMLALKAARGGTLVLEDAFALRLELQDSVAADALASGAMSRLVLTSELPVDQVRASGRLSHAMESLLRGADCIALPRIDERDEDASLLAVHLLARSCERLGLPPRIPTQGALRALALHELAGGARELASLMDRAATFAEPGARIDASDLGLSGPLSLGQPLELPPEGLDLPQILERLEAQLIDESLLASGNSRQGAANLLGLQRTTLVQKLRRRHGGAAPQREVLTE